jgi:hypothetical protein
MPSSLEAVAAALVRRAQRQGFIVPRDVKSELKLAGLDESLVRDVLTRARSELNYRQGRYYPVAVVSPRLQKEQEQQRFIHQVVQRLIRQHKKARKQRDRRGAERIDFIQPVRVQLEDGRQFTLLSRDLSANGIRLLGTKRLLGQKVKVQIPQANGEAICRLLVRILWTCAIADDLFENGGSFLEVVAESTS